MKKKINKFRNILKFKNKNYEKNDKFTVERGKAAEINDTQKFKRMTEYKDINC